MIDINAKPTLEDVMKLKERMESLWSETHAKFGTADSYYRRTFPLWDEGVDRPSYHPSTAAHIIDHAVDQQLAYRPKFHRPPKGEGQIHEDRADKIESALAAVMEAAAREETMLPWKQVGKNLLLYGYAVVEGPIWTPLPEPERIQGESKGDYEFRRDVYEAELQNWMPIRIRVPHPASVLMDPAQKRPRFAIKVTQHFAYEVAQLAQKKARTRRDVQEWDSPNPYDEVMVTEFWSPYWHAYIVNGQMNVDNRAQGDLLYVERNSWGYCPFGQGFAGFGGLATSTQKVAGATAATGLSRWNPADLAVSMLEPIMDSLKVQAQQLTGKQNALMEAAFNVRGTTRDEAEMAEKLSRADIVQMQPGELWWLDVPNLPAWLFEVGQEVDRDINLGSYAMQLAGFKEPGISTVGQQAILSQAASRKFVAPLRQMEDMATNVAQDLLRLVSTIGEPIGTGDLVLRPADIDGHYAIQATFEVIDPVFQLQAKELGMREYQMGLKSDESYWATDAGMEDVAGERKRLLKQAVRNSPEIQQIMAREVAKEMGLQDDLDALMLEVEAEQKIRQQAALLGGQGPLLGPDGQPLASSLGGAATLASPNGPAAALRQIRQPLTPNVTKPGLYG